MISNKVLLKDRFWNVFLVVLPGLLYGLCLPPLHWWWLSPFLLVPVWIAFDRSRSIKTDFVNGTIFGGTCFLMTFRWAPKAISSIMGINLVNGWLLALLAFICVGFLYGLLFCVMRSIWNTKPWLIFFIWPGFDFLISLMIPFTLGYAWGGNVGSAQVADLFGVYFLTSLICLYSYLLFLAYKRKERRNQIVLLLGILLTLQYGYGAYRMSSILSQSPADRVFVTLLQPNIDPRIKRDQTEQTFKSVVGMLRHAASISDKNALIVLPESIFVPSFHENDIRISYLQEIIKPTQRLVLGFNIDNEKQYFNSMGMIIPQEEPIPENLQMQTIKADGFKLIYYSKNKLLLFGEYLPLPQWLINHVSFLKNWQEHNEFSAGDRSVVFPWKQKKVFPFICIESMYGHWISSSMQKLGGADILLNISEDGWLGSLYASQIHGFVLPIRSIETRKPLLRCTNIGVSMALNSTGLPLITHAPEQTFDANAPLIYQAEIPIKTTKSLFLQGGFFFNYLIALLFLFCGLKPVFTKIRLVSSNK